LYSSQGNSRLLSYTLIFSAISLRANSLTVHRNSSCSEVKSKSSANFHTYCVLTDWNESVFKLDSIVGGYRHESFQANIATGRITPLPSDVPLWCVINHEVRIFLDWLFIEVYLIRYQPV
jgi:hypothetical protein